MRSVIPALAHRYRLVFADAPFGSEAGPQILPVFEGCGPWRRWGRWKEGEHAQISEEKTRRAMEDSMVGAMRKDDEAGATGEWVGLLGFSQGAKIAVSMLYENQLRLEEQGGGEMPVGFAGGRWRFAVLMAGRGPFVKLSERPRDDIAFNANEVVHSMPGVDRVGRELLKLPTFHVWGTSDPGLEHHRWLKQAYCQENSVRVMEWDGDHRLPIKTADVKSVAEGIEWATEVRSFLLLFKVEIDAYTLKMAGLPMPNIKSSVGPYFHASLTTESERTAV